MTLREHLQAIRDERDAVHQGDPFEAYVVSMGIVSVHAMQALAILDGAERRFQAHDHENGGDAWYRLVPDASPDPQDTNT